ncbi:GNAT family N-acetyltransferase [Paenibacillus maysiensis]|uniref:GNAT family N-acetyltransferase n=1 Tax=Paenibacillus maysiensis TaxID=1155954 RepID=UPI001FD77B2C|nr:Imm53 family immunity protein [Paenibacillus maysiensis]
MVYILDLEGTILAEKDFEPISMERSESNWIHYKMAGTTFKGYGGVQNLNELLIVFKNRVESLEYRQVQIETNRLIIRDICRSDWESIHTYTSLPEVTRHIAWGPNTEEATKAYIEQVLASQQEQPRQDYELAFV